MLLASGKQVDRLLSNPGIDVDALPVRWVPYVAGSRFSITVAMDWTDFDACGQAMIMSPAALPRGLPLLCRHGRATPLVWLTVGTATLKDRRRACEDQVLMRLAEVLPAGVRVRIVADRGFGDQKLYRMLAEELKFDVAIRFRGNTKAAEWVGAGGRARVLRGAAVTAAGCPVATVVCVQAKDMKQPWCLAASVAHETARALVNLCGKRWGIEGAFRGAKACASAWAWARCTSAPPTGATACGWSTPLPPCCSPCSAQPSKRSAMCVASIEFWRGVPLLSVLPQAWRIALPGVVNIVVDLFKDTTPVSVVGLFDLMGVVNQSLKDQSWLGLAQEGYAFAALLFFGCCLLLSLAGTVLERRLRQRPEGG